MKFYILCHSATYTADNWPKGQSITIVESSEDRAITIKLDGDTISIVVEIEDKTVGTYTKIQAPSSPFHISMWESSSVPALTIKDGSNIYRLLCEPKAESLRYK